jgi:hypothetical protein
MAFLAPIAGELVLDAEAGFGAGNIVQGAETLATTFKNEVIKGGVFGLGEGALFGAGEKLYHHIKQDMGFEKKPDDKQPVNINRKRKHTRKVG